MQLSSLLPHLQRDWAHPCHLSLHRDVCQHALDAACAGCRVAAACAQVAAVSVLVLGLRLASVIAESTSRDRHLNPKTKHTNKTNKQTNKQTPPPTCASRGASRAHCGRHAARCM